MKGLKVAGLGLGIALLQVPVEAQQQAPSPYGHLKATAAESSIISCWIRTDVYKETPHGGTRRDMQDVCSRAKHRTKAEVAQGKPPFGGKMPKFYDGRKGFGSPPFEWFFK